MSEQTNSSGGFLVPNEMTQAIIDLREAYGVFRQNADIQPMGRDTSPGETIMRSILLLAIGIPLPIILLLAFCTHHL